MSLSAASSFFLNFSRNGDSTTFLGKLFQCITTLTEKKSFLESWYNLRPWSLILSLLAGRRVWSPSHLLPGSCKEQQGLCWASSSLETTIFCLWYIFYSNSCKNLGLQNIAFLTEKYLQKKKKRGILLIFVQCFMPDISTAMYSYCSLVPH